jgi:hypothetical protein
MYHINGTIDKTTRVTNMAKSLLLKSENALKPKASTKLILDPKAFGGVAGWIYATNAPTSAVQAAAANIQRDVSNSAYPKYPIATIENTDDATQPREPKTLTEANSELEDAPIAIEAESAHPGKFKTAQATRRAKRSAGSETKHDKPIKTAYMRFDSARSFSALIILSASIPKIGDARLPIPIIIPHHKTHESPPGSVFI